MDLNKKLQELRKQKGLTQEELALQLYVSRTAISKWESGRGYPNIESLKAIAKFYSITVDELLSSDEMIIIAQEEQRQTKNHLCDLIFGLLDICMLLLFFLPLFAQRANGVIRVVSLSALDGGNFILKVAYLAVIVAMTVIGILILALQNCQSKIWMKFKTKISLILGGISVMLFTAGLHPYAAIFSFALLTVKAFILIKRQ